MNQAESVALLDGGGRAYPRMLDAIGAARESIYLEVYSFAPQGIGSRFVEVLVRASGRGVDVEVELDAFGSIWGGAAVAAQLTRAGCRVRIFNRFGKMLRGNLGRNHRKVLVVDDEIAFIGGINIGDDYMDAEPRKGWADLALEIRGPQCRALRQKLRGFPQPPVQSSIRIYLSSMGAGRRLERRYLKAFRSARHQILIAHGYFIPDRAIVRALLAARKRGVRVRLLLAGRSDVPFAVAATRSRYQRLLEAGVEVYEWNASVLHAKAAAIDGKRFLVGSFNLDPLSLANLEVLAEVSDPRLTMDGEAWIERHLDGAHRVMSDEPHSPLQRWIYGPVGRLALKTTVAISKLIAPSRRPIRRKRGSS
ncbi:MAG: phospholipase D-like domain-containing protein [Polyangiaceae bacterium]